ncbi:SpoIIE family protein phosphatase [Paenibacillus eucommiae]|uniref:Sigma-B regulation protein RsbU (Phosphoserine phosphatase) n=1 Tax=Paenibacillus eucommiae TaxID=1355755 RepID=A0ABS4IQU7_9BACL|nr:fused response regulator/phosphatase [Paenibacillus eucommiae]MBP1988979.1 sigma-B regulation protein RsbU (phosphoserine phosphatase) [Paenibacillus eucommiae]
MHILIVDDNPVNLIVIEKILKSAGYMDYTAMTSAMELFDYLKNDSIETNYNPVDLILMDIMMPIMDGIEACRQIQRVERLRDIPIIMVTALGDSLKLAEALEAGAIDYVIKPINKIELIARIRVALRLKYEKDWHKENEQRIRHELELAKQVQSNVLSLPLQNEQIEIKAVYHPSSELAGDYYAWYQIDEDRYGVILLDIMGHGISSSLVCMFISSVMQDTITKYVSPEIVIAELNRYMNQLNSRNQQINYYFTAIYLLIDVKNRTIEYVNAGHPPGLILENGVVKAELNQGSCAVGFFGQMDIQKAILKFENSIEIVMYTDGLLEALEEPEQEPLHRLTEELTRCTGLDLSCIIDNLLPPEVLDIQSDDICIVRITVP